jgi:hypothetical protein
VESDPVRMLEVTLGIPVETRWTPPSLRAKWGQIR